MTQRSYKSKRISRRSALELLGAAALLGTSARAYTANGAAACVLTPQETSGPYPLFEDATEVSAHVRRDIAEGKPGVPLDLALTVLNVTEGCAPVPNALVYVWHCDKDGSYSGYDYYPAGTREPTFCRGAQRTDNAGIARFSTIYPGWYPGRITHVHFRVYLRNDLAATSQLVFPQDITTAVYKTHQYAAHGQNTSIASVSEDDIFADGARYQLCSAQRSRSTAGYDAALTVGIAV